MSDKRHECDEQHEHNEDRRALLEHSGSHLRQWSTHSLAGAVAILALFQEGFRTYLLRLLGFPWSMFAFNFIISFLFASVIHAACRVLWYSWLFRDILNATAIPRNDRRVHLEAGREATHLFRLHTAAEDLARENHGCLGELIHWSGIGHNGFVFVLILGLSLGLILSYIAWVSALLRLLKRFVLVSSTCSLP